MVTEALPYKEVLLYLLFLPGAAPDVARDDVTDSLKIADVKAEEVVRWRAAPVFLLCEIEGSEAGETPVPAGTRGIHGEDDVVVVLQEGDAVPQGDGSLPPAEIGLAGLIDEDGSGDGGGQSLCGEHTV